MTTGRTNHTAFAAAPSEPDTTPITALPVNGEKTEYVYLSMWGGPELNVFTTLIACVNGERLALRNELDEMLHCEVFNNRADAEQHAEKRGGFVASRALMKGPLP